MYVWLFASRLVDPGHAVRGQDYHGDGLYDCRFAVMALMILMLLLFSAEILAVVVM